MFPSSFKIADRKVGVGAPVLIIAEAGVSHFGDPGKARALVDLAADAGADVFKTQAFQTDALVASDLGEWRDRLRPKEVSFEFIAMMKERCDARGIVFMCTPHEPSVLPWLDELDVPAFKVGSGEKGNSLFLRQIASRGKPVILSTGMYETADIARAVADMAEAGCREAALLHCVTAYPTPLSQVNLRAMDSIRSVFAGPIGYSDHTEGHQAVLSAVARGAAVVEKHISLDFNVPNAQDWKVSAGPDDLADLVQAIRDVETTLGEPEIAVRDCELPALDWALKRLAVARDLQAGAILNADMLVAQRSGLGVSVSELDSVLGRRLTRPLAKDAPLTLDDLAS